MPKSIINNNRDLLKVIERMEREITELTVLASRLKIAKASITQPIDNQLLTWDAELSMITNSLWQLPAADGAANDILYTDGAGNLDWTAPGVATPAGADTQIQYNAGGVMGAEAAFTYDYNTNVMNVDSIDLNVCVDAGADVDEFLVRDAGNRIDSRTGTEVLSDLSGDAGATFDWNSQDVSNIGTATADHVVVNNDITPDASDSATLGTSSLEFSDLYLADGAVIYLGDDQDVTLTHVPDTGIDIEGNVDINGTLRVRDTFQADAGATIIGDSSIDGNLYNSGSIHVDGLFNADGGADIEGNVDINGTLDVHGAAHFYSSLEVTDLITGYSNMVVNGYVQIDTVADAGTDTNKFLVLDSGNRVDSRTGTEVLSDLSGDAGATFDWNSQDVSNIGTATADHVVVNNDITPDASDSATLGTSSLEFSDLYLADGAVIYLGDDQDVTLTHVPDTGIDIEGNVTIHDTDDTILIMSSSTSSEARLGISSAGGGSYLGLYNSVGTHNAMIRSYGDSFFKGGSVGIGMEPGSPSLDILHGSDAEHIVSIKGADGSSEYLSIGIDTGISYITAGGSGSTNNSLYLRVADAGSETTAVIIDNNSKSTFYGEADIRNALHLGSNNGSSTSVSDSTAKSASVSIPSYDTDEEEVQIFRAFADNTPGENYLNIGGGNASYNCMQDVLVYTGAWNSTTGSLRLRVNEDGHFYLYNLSTDSGTDLIINASDEVCLKSSSRRFKENIEPTKIDSSVLQHFEIVDFDWKKTKKHDYGFIAEDLAILFPGIETYNKGEIQSWDTQKMLTLCVAEIQRLNRKLEVLNEKLPKAA